MCWIETIYPYNRKCRIALFRFSGMHFCMNWDALSFDWNQIRAFLATAETGSFSGAARALRSTQPTVGRQVAALEESLGLVLVERSGRGLMLTQAGRDLLEQVRKMGDAALNISLVADGQSNALSGKVTISATDLLSAEHMPELLAPLREKAPGIVVHVVPSNDLSDLMRREADIAIRHVKPEQPELIAKRIGDFTVNLYAATELLDRLGRPDSLSAIAQLPMVGVADPDRLVGPLNQMGVPISEANFVASSASGVVIWGMVKAGFGISMLPCFLCDNEPGIEKVFPSLPSASFPVWLVTHRELRTSPRIRMVFDVLAEGLEQTVV